MSIFIDKAQLVSAPTPLQNHLCVNAQQQQPQVVINMPRVEYFFFYSDGLSQITLFPFALLVQQQWQRKLLAHVWRQQRHKALLVVPVVDFIPATHLQF